MNYFELYDLPISFNPDQVIVKQQFYALSKKFHPDFYINQIDEKQAEVLELSTLNNKAFLVLKDPQKRLHYILELKNQLPEGENYALPQDFLMQMMDVNETIMDLEFDFDAVKLQEVNTQVDLFEQMLNKELTELTTAFDTAGEEAQITLLKAIKDVYYRNKYLFRIKQSLDRITAKTQSNVKK